MEDNFQHFLVTRFNLKQSIWNSDKKGNAISDPKWLEERYALFLKYCFPSIENQTTKNFKWLVYFDTETPDNYKLKNQELHKLFPQFIPIYVSSFSDFETNLSDDLKTYYETDNNYILTTRLDNDDCLHQNAVEIIQKHFKPIDKAIIDLKNGLALQVVNEYKLSLKTNTKSGPFITLIEKYYKEDTLLTVYDREHTIWVETSQFIDVHTGYYWLQIIHKRNISNGLSNQLTYNKKYLKGYSLLKEVNFTFKYYVFIILKQLRLAKLIKNIRS